MMAVFFVLLSLMMAVFFVLFVLSDVAQPSASLLDFPAGDPATDLVTI